MRLAFTAVSLLIALSASAADDSFLTAGSMNGRRWLQLSEPQRVFWASGFSDGIQSVTGLTPPQAQQLANQFLCDCTVSEMTKGITDFYRDETVRALPVASAWHIEAMKAHGANPEQVQAEVNRMLQALNAPNAK